MDDSTDIMVEPLPLLGVCNLCLHDGVVKSMLIKYEHDGTAETYVEMLLKCFCIDVFSIDLEDTNRLICYACIDKLLNFIKFKEKVETSLKSLEDTVKLQKQTLTSVKKEMEMDYLLQGACDFSDNNVANSLDDAVIDVKQELPDLMDDETDEGMSIGSEGSDSFISKAPRRKPLSNQDPMKRIGITETKGMLRSGLFPFKIYKDRTFSCVICQKKVTKLDDLREHISEHSVSKLNKAFRKLSSSKLQTFYKNNNKLRCKLCLSDMSNFNELKQHIDACVLSRSSNWSKLPFKLEKDQLDCPICKKRFLNFVNLNTHMNEHYPNHICESCGKSFASQARLRGHMRTHEYGDFPCRYCEAVFDRVTKRENHVSKEHKSGLRYACKRCNISLSSFYTKQKHLAEVHNEELKRYKCKACTQSYITPGHLSSHVRRDHLNERNHKCDKCDLAFYTKNALKMHMIKHDGERIHICEICQKSYQRLKTLREHMRIHNNDKRFICPVCGRAFTQKCTLKGHLKVHDRKVEGETRVQDDMCNNRALVICRIESTTTGV